MKTLVLISMGMLAFALQPAANAQNLPAPTSLFTTYEDFSVGTNSGQWSAGWGAAPAADNTFSTDASTVNGAANPTAPGGAGTLGSLIINAGAGASGGLWTDAATGPGINGAAIALVDPGYLGDGVAQAASGNFYIDYSLPDNEGGSYFQVGVLLQYAGNGYFGTAFATSSTDLGFTDPLNGGEVYQATIPYTIAAGGAGSLWGFGFGIMLNTDYSSALPFHVDNISVAAVQDTPEPTTIALIGLGLAGLTLLRRQR